MELCSKRSELLRCSARFLVWLSGITFFEGPSFLGLLTICLTQLNSVRWYCRGRTKRKNGHFYKMNHFQRLNEVKELFSFSCNARIHGSRHRAGDRCHAMPWRRQSRTAQARGERMTRQRAEDQQLYNRMSLTSRAHRGSLSKRIELVLSSLPTHRRECPAITYTAMGFRPRSFPVGGMYVKGIGWLTKVKKNHSLLFSIKVLHKSFVFTSLATKNESEKHSTS